jgi:hypothetical protein
MHSTARCRGRKGAGQIALTIKTYAHVLRTLLGDAVPGMGRMLGEPEEDDDG